MSQSRRRKSPTILLLAVLAAAAAALGWLAVPHLLGTSSDSGSAAAQATGTAGGPNGAASPVATESIPPPYTIKPEPSIVATDTPRPTPSGGAADVSLTYATFDTASGTVQASGFVGGLIEDGGTCTLTLTKGADVVSAATRASADATTTSCGLLQTRRGLAAGSWTAVLSYSSPHATGRSAGTEVSVP